MPAKKGKRENAKVEAIAPENTEEPVVKKGRAVKEAAVEKPKKAPAPKGKAKKTAEDEVIIIIIWMNDDAGSYRERLFVCF